MMTRRDAALSLAAAALATGCATASGPKPAARPIVIAHRGASGHRPEHTLAAYALAIAQGADFIEPDLVMTRDGALVCRHETVIDETTDIAAHPEFADRRTTKPVDGAPMTGWFAEDFTLAELKTLRARERLPALRPANAIFDGLEPIPTFAEVCALAKEAGAKAGRTIGVYPELKHPGDLARAGLDPVAALVAELKAQDLDRPDAAVFVQCFEVGPLERLAGLTRAPLVMLIAADGGPADLAGQGVRYGDLTTDAGLKRIAGFASGIGPQKTLLIPRDAAEAALAPTDLAARAKAAGLLVHPWTFRAENAFLPAGLRRGDPQAEDFQRRHGDAGAEILAFAALGVDGFFCDHPDTAVRALARAAA